MATDIMGLLTGVSKQGIDPMLSQLTPSQQRMEFGRQSAQGIQRAVSGMFGGGASIQEQIQAGLINKKLKEQQVLANTDIGDVESLRDAVKVLQAQGKRTEALAYIRRIEQLEKQESLKETLLKVAKAQGNQEVMDMINDGANLNVVYRLLTQSSGKPPAPAVLSEPEKENYYTVLQQLTDKVLEDSLDGQTRFLPQLITDEKLIGRGRKLKSMKDLTSFFFRVEEARRNNPNIPLESIMLQLSGLGSATIDASEKSTERNLDDEQDNFRGVQGSGGGLKPTGKKGKI